MNKKHVFNSIAVLLLFASVLFALKHYVLDPPDKVDLSLKESIYKLDAKTVIDLIKNEDKNTLEAEQIIEIEGVIKKISYLNNRITILLGFDGKENAFVICDMESNQAIKVKELSTNDTIRLKGVFKGFLEDAIFLNCIISE